MVQPTQESVRYLLCVRLTAILCLLLPHAACPCGLAWNLTESRFADVEASPFASVDGRGNVFLVQHMGNVETVKGDLLPLYLVFKSDSGNRSPVAGYGWSMPFLESTFVQIDENRFCMSLPNGLQRVFGRDKERTSTLRSRELWTAEIRGDSVAACCKCGNRLVFRKGRLISMEVKEGKFDYVYEGDRVAEIREGLRTILRVERPVLTGDVTGIALLHGRRIGLERAKRPLVQVINNRRQRGGTVESLSKIALTNGTVQTFEYGVDERLNETLKLLDRELVWDPTTKAMIRDGGWTYRITPSPDVGGTATIARTSTQHQREAWHRLEAKGEETTEGTDGVKRTRTWFTSGKLRGRERKEIETRNGVETLVRELSYDERGRLIRIRRELTDTFLVYDKDGRLAALVQNGKLVRSYTEDAAALAGEYLE